MSQAACSGNLELVQWLRGEGCPWGWMTCYWAANYGHRELVLWLCGAAGFAMKEGVMAWAAAGGQLELLQWLRAEGCPWDFNTCYYAVEDGHVEVLRWARENGCEWTAKTRDRAEKLGYTDHLGNLVD